VHFLPLGAGQVAVGVPARALGVEAGASREEIIAAHRRLTALVHPDIGGTNAAMQEANAARDLLLEALPAPGAGDTG
jgi:hypothetical protein